MRAAGAPCKGYGCGPEEGTQGWMGEVRPLEVARSGKGARRGDVSKYMGLSCWGGGETGGGIHTLEPLGDW